MSNSSKKTKRKLKELRNRNLMVDAAEQQFRKVGFEQCTMDDIADAALFSKTTLYNYYNRKEDIYLEIAIRAYQKLIELFQAGLDESLPGRQQVVQMGYQFFQFATKFPIYRQALDLSGDPLIYDLSTLEGKNQEKLEISQNIITNLQQEQAKFAQLWIKICQQGQNDGIISSKYPPQAIAFTLGTLTTGLVDEITQRQNFTPKLGLSAEKVFAIAMDFLENGILPPEEK